MLLPTVILLLLLPPLSCLIFQHAAQRYAYAEAARDLKALQQKVLPLMEASFERGPNRNAQDQASAFLRSVSPLVKKICGSANILIFESRMRLVYPRDEQEREALLPLSEACTQYILSAGSDLDGDAVQVETADGNAWLIDFYEMPGKSMRVKYLITYSPISEIGVWVREAAILVLLISSFFALLALAALWLTASSITRPLRRLCRESERIGDGGFDEITPSFSLQELEELRLAMNRIAGKLRRSEEIQRDFFQNVSHDLRTPLMSIGGYAQGIERGLFRNSSEAAHTILEESERLTELVNSLLSLSKLESGQNAPTLGPVRLASPLEDCLDRVNGLALEKQVEFALQPFDHNLYVIGEYELICKVLENLLTNAIRYAKRTVTVSVSAGEGRITVAVSDDGEGIAKSDLSRIFDRCYKGKNGDFGIGLAIARSAAQHMGGELCAANLPANGAVFTLTLDRA